MPEWCPTAFARLEIHGCIVRRTLLPTPLKEAAPLEGSGAHGRLGRLAFVALLLRIAWGPAGLPWGCRRPRHARVAPARRPREAPGPPDLLATACRDRRHPRVFLACLGGGDACPLGAAGDEEAGSHHGAGPWHGVTPRAGGMVLGALRPPEIAVGQGRQRAAELGTERVPQENRGREDTGIGGERPGTPQ